MNVDNTDPSPYPIDGTLDLHQFAPADTKEVVTEYLAECLRRGIRSIRIVHGKGIGVKRQIVRSILDKHPAVASYRFEAGSGGGWGATVVDLKMPHGNS